MCVQEATAELKVLTLQTTVDAEIAAMQKKPLKTENDFIKLEMQRLIL